MPQLQVQIALKDLRHFQEGVEDFQMGRVMLEQQQLYIVCSHPSTHSLQFCFPMGTNTMQLTDQAIKFIFQHGISVSIHVRITFMALPQKLYDFTIALKHTHRTIVGPKGDDLVRAGRCTICGVESNKMRKNNDIF